MIYATGTYGFYGYAFANLGEQYQFVFTAADLTKSVHKKALSYPTFTEAFDSSNWKSEAKEEGGSPFRGLGRTVTREGSPGSFVGVLGMSRLSALSALSILRLLYL
jgi:ubiquitin-like 1-activating enzyme E1 A